MRAESLSLVCTLAEQFFLRHYLASQEPFSALCSGHEHIAVAAKEMGNV